MPGTSARRAGICPHACSGRVVVGRAGGLPAAPHPLVERRDADGQIDGDEDGQPAGVEIGTPDADRDRKEEEDGEARLEDAEDVHDP